MTFPGLRRAAFGAAVVSALLLLVPLVAMRVTPEVNWGPGDFLVAFGLLFVAGMACALGTRSVTRPTQRVAVVAVVLLALAVVWAELAVGLFH